MFIAVLIFVSVLPLVKETSLILLLRTPQEKQKEFGVALQKVKFAVAFIVTWSTHLWRRTRILVGWGQALTRKLKVLHAGGD